MVAIPLSEASEQLLTEAVEANLHDLFREMAARLPGGQISESERLCRHLTFPSNPMFKGVWRTRLRADEADAAIDETLAWFREREAPYLFWWTGPGSEPADLGARLSARGLLSMESQTQELAKGIVQSRQGAPCMIAELGRMNEAALAQVPPGFTIEEIRTEADLLAFRQIFIEVYGIPAWAGQAWVDATLSAGIGKTPWKMYLGKLDGEPVATNMLFNGGGIASVYAVGTLERVRGQGIGGAITLQPLLEARAEGYRYAGLFSSESGVHAYQRIGFEITQGRIDRYLWRA